MCGCLKESNPDNLWSKHPNSDCPFMGLGSIPEYWEKKPRCKSDWCILEEEKRRERGVGGQKSGILRWKRGCDASLDLGGKSECEGVEKE